MGQRVWFIFQVFQGCGNPKISTKGSSSDDKKRRGKVVLEAKSSAQALEMLVSLPPKLPLCWCAGALPPLGVLGAQPAQHWVLWVGSDHPAGG